MAATPETTLRVFVRDECIINKPADAAELAQPKAELVASLAAIFLPRVIESAIGGLAAALKKAGGEQKAQFSGADHVNLYKVDARGHLAPNQSIGALLFVVGRFGGEKPSEVSDPAVVLLRQAKLIDVTDEVDIIFEAALINAPDNTALHLRTTHFSRRRGLTNATRDKPASYVVTVSIVAPDATASGATIGISNIALGSLKNGEFITNNIDNLFRGNLMPWGQMSEASKEAFKADAEGNQANPGRQYMPASFSVTLTETTDGNAFLKALGELLEGTKAEITTEIRKAVLPSKEEKAAAASEAEQLYQGEENAWLEVVKKKAAHDQDGTDAAKRVEYENAQRAWQRALRLLNAAGGKPAFARDPES